MIASGAKAADNGKSGRDACVLDGGHLERMTLGDSRLAREVLQIFVRQSAMLLGRICESEPATVATAAHTMVGSARGIGAWRVADAAERLERAGRERSEDGIGDAIVELKAASLEVTAAIAARLADPSH